MSMELRASGGLAGNVASVLCCEASPHLRTIATGAEDGALCTFDLETSTLLHRLVLPASPLPDADRSVTALAFHPSDAASLFLSASTSVHRIDLRTTPGVVQTFDLAKDEIGALAVNSKGTYLAAGDDTGTVHVVDLLAGRSFKTIKGAHDNICGALAFRPHRPWELLTGGLDMTVARWDFSRGKCLDRWQMGALHEGPLQQAANDSTQDGGERQLFNPPMVHHLAVPCTTARDWCGHVAIAAGDGSILVLDADLPSAASGGGRDTPGGGKDAPPAPSASSKMKPAAGGKGKGAEKGGASGKAAPAASGAAASTSSSGPTGSGGQPGLVVLRRGHTRPASCVAWASVGGRWHVASAAQDKRLLLWDVDGARQSLALPLQPLLVPGSVGVAAGGSRDGEDLGDEAARQAGVLGSGQRAGGEANAGAAGSAGAEGEQACGRDFRQPVASALLKRKPNGLCYAGGDGQVVCVADTGRLVQLFRIVQT